MSRRWTAYWAMIEEVEAYDGNNARIIAVRDEHSDNSPVGFMVRLPLDVPPAFGRRWLGEVARDPGGEFHVGPIRMALPSPNEINDDQLDATYRPRGENSSDTKKPMRIFAVGATAGDAVRAFCWSLNEKLEEESLEILRINDKNEFQWEGAFVVEDGRTSFRVAGKYVPGGAVLTWWS